MKRTQGNPLQVDSFFHTGLHRVARIFRKTPNIEPARQLYAVDEVMDWSHDGSPNTKVSALYSGFWDRVERLVEDAVVKRLDISVRHPVLTKEDGRYILRSQYVLTKPGTVRQEETAWVHFRAGSPEARLLFEQKRAARKSGSSRIAEHLD